MSIAAPATNPASDLELKLPATIGTAGQVLKNSSTPGTLEFGTAATNTPAFAVRPSSDQAADSNNVWYKVEWDTEDFDTDNAFDNTNDKFVVPAGAGGVYQLNVQVSVTNQSESAEMDLRVYKNGSALTTPRAMLDYSGGSGNFTNVVNHSYLYDLNATDYLEIYIWHGSGGTNVIESDYTAWSMFKLAGTS